MIKRVIVTLFAGLLATVSYSQKDSSKSEYPEFLKNLKITGLIQTQYQRFESGSEGINNRITVRRGRLKFLYAGSFTQYVLQFHATERNLGPDEVYIAISDPWTKTVTLTSGIFNRPFGNEISYSSTYLESDERARVTRTLFPDEKDLGVQLSYHPRQTSPFNFLWLEAGIFNGTGPVKEDFDDRKNFMGRLYSKKSFFSGIMDGGLGISWFKGGYSNQRSLHYEWNNGFVPVINDSLALSEQNIKGIDAQFAVKWPLGNTRLRFEYLWGKQAGSFEGSKTPNMAPADRKRAPLPSFHRNCDGGYLIFIHSLPKINVQLVLKYDWYDPNTNVASQDIGTLPNTGPADMLYKTFGTGANWDLNKNIRLMVYHNFVRNERTTLLNYSSDLKNNYWILRLQVGF